MVHGHTCAGMDDHICKACESEEGRLYIEPEEKTKQVINTFPLTPDEAKLLYDELVSHTFSRHHPMYLYASPLLSRIREFLEDNNDNFRVC